jgi:predicted amidohydrolase
MAEPELVATGPWYSHASAAPSVAFDGRAAYRTAANGTRTCYGGWQFEFEGLRPGQYYEVSVTARPEGIVLPRDTLICEAIWAKLPAESVRVLFSESMYLLPQADGRGSVRFGRTLGAPAGASTLTVRCAFRWATRGEAIWSIPTVVAVEAPAPRRRQVRVAVVTGSAPSRPRSMPSVAANLEYYGGRLEAACRQWSPQLAVLPEIAVQYGVRGHPLDLAVPVPGPETEVFSGIAQRHRVRIVLGLYERDGDAAYNSAVLIAPDGSIDGRYRKVHLATGGEMENGLLAGDSFPVHETEVGRIGCNICMDSSAAESARMVGLNGADILCLPIMGDHRADRLTIGPDIFNESRWKAIMRTRAMDNQLCMVVARNTSQGSCVVDRAGEIVAWNEGDVDHIFAAVDLDGGYKIFDGDDLVDINWVQRRPHIYGAFVDPDCYGSLR